MEQSLLPRARLRPPGLRARCPPATPSRSQYRRPRDLRARGSPAALRPRRPARGLALPAASPARAAPRPRSPGWRGPAPRAPLPARPGPLPTPAGRGPRRAAQKREEKGDENKPPPPSPSPAALPAIRSHRRGGHPRPPALHPQPRPSACGAHQRTLAARARKSWRRQRCPGPGP